MSTDSNASESGFLFSFSRAKETQRDLDLQLSAAEARIDKIVNKIELGDHHVIGLLLTLSHDPEELRKVARALERVADIIPSVDEIRAEKSMIDLALKNPDKFKGKFGDFTSELDSFLSTDIKDGE